MGTNNNRFHLSFVAWFIPVLGMTICLLPIFAGLLGFSSFATALEGHSFGKILLELVAFALLSCIVMVALYKRCFAKKRNQE